MSSVVSLAFYSGWFVCHVCLFNCKFTKVFAVRAMFGAGGHRFVENYLSKGANRGLAHREGLPFGGEHGSFLGWLDAPVWTVKRVGVGQSAAQGVRVFSQLDQTVFFLAVAYQLVGLRVLHG